MELVSKILFALVTCCSSSYAANETGLRALTDYDCGCPGQNASYICTVSGGVITVWTGTAFDCDGSNNEILLTHIGFQTTMGQCNDGAIVGYGIENVNNSYISRLDVRLSADLQDQTVICSVDDGRNMTPLGNDTLIVSTPSVLPPSPERISILVANPQELMFGWDQIEYDCPILQYNFTSENCGICIEVDRRVVSCTGFQTSSAGITCTFTVSSIVCGNVTGPGSMQLATINLKVPDAPTVQSLPRYLDGRIQVLICLLTTFPIVVSPYVSNEIDGSVNNYTIRYTDSTFGSTCGIANIPSSSCVGGMCSHSFDILNNSLCPPTTGVFVSVIASNVFGNSPPSTPLVREGLNNLVNVHFDPNLRTITCTFLNQPPNIMKQCNANITYGDNCESFLNTYGGMGTGDTVETQQLEVVSGVVDYCFLVTAKSNNITVLVEGILQNIGPGPDRQEDRVIAAIVVPLVLILLLIIILLVTLMVIYRAEKYINTTKSNVLITFSVKDEPGSLAKALKVFMDCNINILGLNTHLHHAEFERDDGSGNKVNYVYCMCKKELEHKSYLERELKEFEVEFKDDDQGHNDSEPVRVTAKIKVKDIPGGLWKAIHKIGEGGINIAGVNTLSDRESMPGYKDNYVKCCCSQRSLHSVCTKLKNITGKEVKIKFISEEKENTMKERAIEFLVTYSDEVGALVNILKIISDMGINISGLNLDHLPPHVINNRITTDGGYTTNYIECSFDEKEKDNLCSTLRRKGAVYADLIQSQKVPTGKLNKDPNYKIIVVTIQNEAGSLCNILKVFCDLNIEVIGVNTQELAFADREAICIYKHNHMIFRATDEQEEDLKHELLVTGLAIDIKPHKRIQHGGNSST